MPRNACRVASVFTVLAIVLTVFAPQMARDFHWVIGPAVTHSATAGRGAISEHSTMVRA